MSFRHFLVHKPYGFLSQFILVSKKKKRLLGELHDFPEGTMSIGRLDKDSEGLLLLTTNGKVSALINGRKTEKEYYAQVDGLIDQEAIEKLCAGVTIKILGEEYQTLPCEVRKLEEAPVFQSKGKRIRDDRHGPTSWISVTLREGKNRQVRKMTAVVGFPTLRLVRARIANMWLADMKEGEVIEVEKFDL